MPTPERTSVGRYELRKRLGVGGMGTVWHAWDPTLRRDVAVKEVLLPDHMSEADHAEARARTLREAQATARISHTAIVTIHDVLEHESSPWIVMELLSGSSLQHHVDAHGPLPVERVEQAARSLLGGLRAAHAVGVTHRDVKPANIMLTDDDRTVLTDFGIANVDGSTALTQAGVYIGSPEYMAPERFEGERALPASDLWSLGVTLYSLLEGRSPFKRDSITGMISAVLTSPMPPNLTVNEAADSPRSAPLRALIAALLTREVSQRPGPAEALELLERERRAVQKGALPQESAPPRGTPAQGTPPPGVSPQSPPTWSPPTRSAPVQAPPPQRAGTPAWGRPPPQPGRPRPPHPGSPRPHPSQPNPARLRPPAPRRPESPPTQRVSTPAPLTDPASMDAAQRFVQGVGHTGPNPPVALPAPSSQAAPTPSAPERPSGVLTAMVMLGINALVLFVLTLIGITNAAEATGPQWGGVFLFGAWSLISAVGVFGLFSRSRSVFALVVTVQGIGAVFLTLRMFAVFIHTPELLVVYALTLLYTLTIGALLLLPATSRTYFGLG